MTALPPERQQQIIADVLSVAANALPLGRQLEERMHARHKEYSDAELFVAEEFMRDLINKLRERARTSSEKKML